MLGKAAFALSVQLVNIKRFLGVQVYQSVLYDVSRQSVPSILSALARLIVCSLPLFLLH